MKRKKKPSDSFQATFYTLLAVGLFIGGLSTAYPESLYFILASLVVGACAYYWISKALRKTRKRKG